MGNYEKLFRRLEASFRPRKDYTHKEVVEDLASVAQLADSQIKHLVSEINKSDEKIKSLYYGLALSALANVILLIVALR